jgi:DNA-binding MurR/RpiR family transcriptional regulator
MKILKTGGLKMIKEMMDKLPPSEKKIAEYILNNPKNTIDMTTHQLAEEANASSSAVVRLSKSLGLKGFQDLKLRIFGDLNIPTESVYRDIEANEGAESIISKITENSIKGIQETSEIIDINKLNDAVKAIEKSNKILFFGVGASSLVCMDAEQKFVRVNKNAYSSSDAHKMSVLVANLDKNDVFFGVSFSGETKEVFDIMKLAKRRGVITISLTKYGKSKISNLADINLFTSNSKESPLRSSATSSRISQLHIIDLLFMCYAANYYDKTAQCIDTTREFINIYKKEGR